MPATVVDLLTFRPVGRHVAGMFLHRLRRRRQAGGLTWEDLEAAALVGLWKATVAFRSDRGAAPRTFAHLVCRRAITSYLRLAASRGSPAGPLEQDVPYTPAPALDDAEEFERLLRPLAERDRQLFRLIYRDGLTLKEAGDVLGLSESAACLRRRDGLAELRAVV